MSDVIPPEVVENILSRLPVTPLLRFRSVSKPWRALIDDPHFIESHLNQSIHNNTHLGIINRDCYFYSIDFDSLDNATKLDHPLKSPNFGTELKGSCNGLLLLSNLEEDNIIWNPSTRKYWYLPVTGIDFPEHVFCGCDIINFGLGYDHASDDYKVMRVVQFDTFDSEVKPYKLVNGVLVSGALHWVVRRDPESKANLVCGFDLGSEEYRLIPLPEFSDEDFHMSVNELGGCLCVVCNYHFLYTDIWVMKVYGVKESWTKLFSVAQPRDIDSFEYVRPLAYSKSGEKVLMEKDSKSLIWFDLENMTIEEVCIRGMPKNVEATIYLGSLVQLSGGGGSEGKKQQLQEQKKKKKNLKKSYSALPACNCLLLKLVFSYSALPAGHSDCLSSIFL
ncbi:hypothetical protein RJ639_029726 [Escallonia herrerae]|uniref:F-box domain-containing protein n=1 Tax=Escallonia herrerae TaxID=1293975 RepID=A0AA88WZ84_9ASTE|nr:hypothetical protein RJ639_029726 [Escallonia herrerae]